MLLTRKEANNFMNSVKARYIAEAGIKRTIMDIRAQVASSSYSNLKTYITTNYPSAGTTATFGAGKYTVTVVSEEGKVNINTFDPEPDTPNSQLDILETFLTKQQIANIVDYRDTDGNNTTVRGAAGNIEGTAQCKNRPFDSIDEIMIATGISKATLDAGVFPNRNRDKITVNKPIIRGGLLGKYYKNITGASPNVAIDHSSFSKKVVELGTFNQYDDGAGNEMPGTDGDSGDKWAETHDAEMAGGSALVTVPSDFGMNYFCVIWYGYLEILPSEVGTPIDFWVASDDGARFYINDGTVDQLVCDIWTDTAGANYPWARNVPGTFTFMRPGWYPIRLEFYDQDHYNSVQLKWKDPSFGPALPIPASRLGYDPPTEVASGYNHAGMYTITATASVLSGTVTVATKQVTAVAEIFDTWTQTTKEEFYSAWFNKYGDFSNGAVFNVNWLDSCPTDEDYWDAGASKMHWDGTTYVKTPDSLKLGYWDNFDEDPAFSSVMMKGYQYNRAWWGFGSLNISYQDFKDQDGDGDDELYLETNTFEAKHFELNRNYFVPNTPGIFVRSWVQQPAPSKRIAWRGGGTLWPGSGTPPQWPLYPGSTRNIYYYDINGNNVLDAGEPEVYPVYDSANNPVYIYNPTAQWSWNLESIPAPGTYTYYQPEAPFCGCWIYAKGNADDPRDLPQPPRPGSLIGYGFKTMHTDADGYVQWIPEPRPLWPDGDTNEIRLGQGAFFYTQFNYVINAGQCTEVLSMIGSDNGVNNAVYYGWINGILGNNTAGWADWSKAYPNGPIFKFVANNQYLGWDWADFDRGQHIIGPTDWDKSGAVTKMNTLWDNIRCIPQSGYLVSVPFYSGSSPIRWGTVSWTRQTPPLPQTNIDMYTRKTTTTFPSTDSGWTVAASNGAAVGGTEPWMQYKAVLTSSAINRNDYTQSSRTPVLEDVTITYMPVIQIKYWREGS